MVNKLRKSIMGNQQEFEGTLGFFDVVIKLEQVLEFKSDPIALLDLLDKENFVSLRSKIIQTFQVGDMDEFEGSFGTEVEIGDVSDAVRDTTMGMYPQSTPMDQQIGLEERKKWCASILENMDNAARFF